MTHAVAKAKLNCCGRSHAALKTVLMLFGALSTGSAAYANDLVVQYDQSQILRLPRPVAEIIIGNASIADVTVQSANTLVVTGKSFGVTNVIALDKERNVIQDQRVIVQRDENGLVNLTKAGARQTYACAPRCTPVIMIGDDSAYFSQITGHSGQKRSFSESAETGAPQGGGQ